jgi:Domain of unknown function (DUF3336)
VIRLFIRAAEYLIARPKHRKLRRLMMQSKSYAEWYSFAKKLDQSQKRDRWLDTHDTSERYNWAMIKELINQMKKARDTNDAMLALAALQQCTRKVRLLFLLRNHLLTNGFERAECWWYHEWRFIFIHQYGRAQAHCQ